MKFREKHSHSRKEERKKGRKKERKKERTNQKNWAIICYGSGPS
jgi:hypothetical protein